MNDPAVWSAAVFLAVILVRAGVATVGMTSVAAAQSNPPQAYRRASRSQAVDAGQAGQAGATAPAEAASATDDSGAVGSAISVQLDLDFSSACLCRGIRPQVMGPRALDQPKSA